MQTLNETDTEYFFLTHRLTSNIKRQCAQTIPQSSSHQYMFETYSTLQPWNFWPEIIPFELLFQTPSISNVHFPKCQRCKRMNFRTFSLPIPNCNFLLLGDLSLFSTNRWETPNPRQRTRWWWSCTGPTFFQKAMGRTRRTFCFWPTKLVWWWNWGGGVKLLAHTQMLKKCWSSCCDNYISLTSVEDMIFISCKVGPIIS